MAEKLNIFQKLLEVRKACGYLEKENKGHQYKFVGSSQVLGALRETINDVGLILVPSVNDHNVISSQSKTGATVYFTELDVMFTWVDVDNPESKIECPWYGQGIDTAGEKGVGKALTYAEKYFMLKFFNIPTDKLDPDSFQRKQGASNGDHSGNAPSASNNKSGGNGQNRSSGGNGQVKSPGAECTEAQRKKIFAVGINDHGMKSPAIKAMLDALVGANGLTKGMASEIIEDFDVAKLKARVMFKACDDNFMPYDDAVNMINFHSGNKPITPDVAEDIIGDIKGASDTFYDAQRN